MRAARLEVAVWKRLVGLRLGWSYRVGHRMLAVLSNVLLRNIALSKEFETRYSEIDEGVDITGMVLSGSSKKK